MELIIVSVAVLIMAGGVILRVILRPGDWHLRRTVIRQRLGEEPARTEHIWSPAAKILIPFLCFVILFGLLTLVQYWDSIRKNKDGAYFATWLFSFMIAGMFAQVLATNHKSGKALLAVSVSELVFPLLFSVIVYYPIWAIAATAPRNFFPLYAAFLNGYFWESVVSAARVPTPPKA